MNFDALKEQLLDRLRQIWAQIRESGPYIQIREKYEELTPNAQKGVNLAGIVVLLLIIFAIPLSNISSSSSSMASFEENKQLIRDLLNVQREVSSAPDVPNPPDPGSIRQRMQAIFSEAGLGAEQVKGVEDAVTSGDPPTGLIPPTVSQKGVAATLVKLNLKQVLDISYQLQTIASNLYVTSMDMTANKDDNHYYDVIFRVVGFTIEETAEAASPPGGGPPSGAKTGVKPPPPPPPAKPGGK